MLVGSNHDYHVFWPNKKVFYPLLSVLNQVPQGVRKRLKKLRMGLGCSVHHAMASGALSMPYSLCIQQVHFYPSRFLDLRQSAVTPSEAFVKDATLENYGSYSFRRPSRPRRGTPPACQLTSERLTRTCSWPWSRTTSRLPLSLNKHNPSKTRKILTTKVTGKQSSRNKTKARKPSQPNLLLRSRITGQI